MIERRANPRQIVPCTPRDLVLSMFEFIGLVALGALLLFGTGYVVGLLTLTGAPTP